MIKKKVAYQQKNTIVAFVVVFVGKAHHQHNEKY